MTGKADKTELARNENRGVRYELSRGCRSINKEIRGFSSKRLSCGMRSKNLQGLLADVTTFNASSRTNPFRTFPDKWGKLLRGLNSRWSIHRGFLNH